MRNHFWHTLILSAALGTLGIAHGGELRLPDIGSSAGSMMSPYEQQAYGADMLNQMRAYNMVLDDPLLNDYVASLGYRLVAHSSKPGQSFTFFVLRDNQLNAFAAPGGYIASNVGLITAMDSEDEYAAVLAHEIAHVTQDHLLRAFEDMQKSSLPIALAMLGTAIAASGRSDDTAQAAIVAGTALIQQRQINFTRQDESEADRLGIQKLARAGFDPHAMARTFATMQRVMRVNGIDVPEFLRTHPVDTRRIADAKSRADQINRSMPPVAATNTRAGQTMLTLPLAQIRSAAPASQAPVSSAAAEPTEAASRFELMRERARVLAASSATSMAAWYADNLAEEDTFDVPANRYGYALALTRARQPEQAISQLQPLLAAFPGSVTYQLAMAHALDQAGRQGEAQQTYERLSSSDPGNRAIALAYANSMIDRGDAQSAVRARQLLRPLVARHADDPELQTSFARACQLSGDTVRAAEAYAAATWLNGRSEDALNQLERLLKNDELDYYQRTRVEARIAQMTPLVLELRKRSSRTPPSSAQLSWHAGRDLPQR